MFRRSLVLVLEGKGSCGRGGRGREGRGEERRERERELVNKVNEKSVDERMIEVEDSLARNESAQVQWDEKERIFTREFEWIVR